MPFYFSSISCNYVLMEHKKELLQIVNHSWDIILTDSLFSTCGYAIALLSNAKYVLMHSTDVEDGHAMAKSYARLTLC